MNVAPCTEVSGTGERKPRRRGARQPVAIVVLGIAGLIGCSGGGSDGGKDPVADEAAMTAADKIVCERAYSADFVPGVVLATPEGITSEWARIAKAAAKAHPEFRAKALALQKEVDEGVAFYEEHGIADDENAASALYDELSEMCADKNYDLDYGN